MKSRAIAGTQPPVLGAQCRVFPGPGFHGRTRAEAAADEVRLPLGCRGIKEYLTLFWDSFASSPFSPATSTAFFSVAQDPSLLQAELPGYGK